MINVYSRKLKLPFDQALLKVSGSLQRRGFGIITSIDVKSIVKERMNVEFRNYTILGACNPEFAYKAITMESHIGVMLPCQLVVEEHENGEVEVSATNPLETMERVQRSRSLNDIATQVDTLLRAALDDLDKEFVESIPTQALPTTSSKAGIK